MRHYGSTYHGTYEPRAEISGFVTDPSNGKQYPPAAIVIMLGGEVVASTNEFENRAMAGGSGSFPTAFTGADILQERINVIAIDHRGAPSTLRIDGAVQLGFIRDALTPSEIETLIDFGLGGNSVEYVEQAGLDRSRSIPGRKGTKAQSLCRLRCLGRGMDRDPGLALYRRRQASRPDNACVHRRNPDPYVSCGRWAAIARM